MPDGSKTDTAKNLEDLLRQGQAAIASAEATKASIARALADGKAVLPAGAPEPEAVRCPECYGRAFRPAPVFNGDREYTCVRDDCQTQFRVFIEAGKIVKVETLN